MAKSMDTMPRNRWSRSGETGGHDGAKFAPTAVGEWKRALPAFCAREDAVTRIVEEARARELPGDSTARRLRPCEQPRRHPGRERGEDEARLGTSRRQIAERVADDQGAPFEWRVMRLRTKPERVVDRKLLEQGGAAKRERVHVDLAPHSIGAGA